MSKKPMKVVFPVINRGGRMSESKSRLEEKKEELEGLKLESDILDIENKIERRRSGGEPATEPQKDTLGDTLVKEVVLPIVKRSLEPDKSSTTQDALKVASKALDRAGRGTPPAAGNTITDIVTALGQFKDLIKDDSSKAQLDKLTEQVKALGERPEKEGDLDMIDKVLGIVDKIQERVKPTGEGSSDGYYDFEKWKTEQERKNLMQDRAFNLRIRQQDKEQDIKLAALGIEKERNDLIMSGLKRIGVAIGGELTEEDDYEEDEAPASTKGRGQLRTEKCEVCGAKILIPPEAQVAGKEIKCSECPAIFTWE